MEDSPALLDEKTRAPRIHSREWLSPIHIHTRTFVFANKANPAARLNLRRGEKLGVATPSLSLAVSLTC